MVPVTLISVLFAARVGLAGAAGGSVCEAGGGGEAGAAAGCADVAGDSSSLLVLNVHGARSRQAPGSSTPKCPTKRQGCIGTPEEWFEAFDCFEDGCVSPDLYGHLGTSNTLSKNRSLAFLSGRTDLENVLTINKGFQVAVRMGKLTEKEAKIRVAAAFCVIVGYALKDIGGKNTFTVLKLPPGITAVVPSWELLFKWMEDFGVPPVPFEVQKEITLAYSSVMDPVMAFSKVAGCDYDKMLQYLNGNITNAGCNNGYYTALELAGYGGAKGFYCFDNFVNAVEAKKIKLNATTVRAAINTCLDASELFTGNGLGYDNIASPLVAGKTSGMDYFPGREFIVPNLVVESIAQQTRSPFYEFPADFQVQNQAFLNPDVGFWEGLPFPFSANTTR